mgnify:CR=1 FL=1
MPRILHISNRVVTEYDLDCPDCGSFMVLTTKEGRLLYRCARRSQTNCCGAHGAQSDGKPQGIPAPWPVRAVRKRTHAVFDLLWKGPSSRMTRPAAYRWLQGAMQMTEPNAHISRFDVAQCEHVIALMRADFGLEPEPVPGEGQVGFFEVKL